MSLFFLFNNLHFSLEILGVLVFLVVAWLAIDSFLIRRDFTTVSRGVGFLLLAVWQIIHALDFSSDIVIYTGYLFYITGIIFVIINLTLEHPVERPSFQAIIVLPGLSVLLLPLNIAITIGLASIAFLSFNQYQKELKKTIGPFVLGFLFFSLGALSSVFYKPDSMDTFWFLGHVSELLGFLFLAWWVRGYLATRVREEMLIIFTSFTLFMAIVVSLTFSSILIQRIEVDAKESLLTNTKVFEFTTERFKEEAFAKARLIATRENIIRALEQDDFLELERLTNVFLEDEKLGFLTTLDSEGEVIFRAQGLTQKGENLREERAINMALDGTPFVTIERSPVEKLSIRAASPITKGDDIVGVVAVGFPLDNALVDRIKKITGLEISIFDNDIRVATTLFNPDGRTRSIGIKQIDKRVLDTVLVKGQEITVRTTILSRPFIASYLPLRNADNEIVGMISASKPQQEILETAQATNRLTLIVVIIIMLILTTPIYVLTRRLSSEVSKST